MSLDRRDVSITLLHVVVGVVLLLGAGLEVARSWSVAGAAHAFSLPWIRMTLASTEVVAAILFLVPATVRLGGFLLLAIVAAAAVIHLAHGQNPAAFAVYVAAVLVVLAHRGGRGALAGGPAR
jgi:hypothetical protein